MSDRHHLAVDPWHVEETELDLDDLARTESLFALANGHLGLRGNLEEGEPAGAPGTYLASVFDNHPLPHAEPGFGYPEDGQTILNVTNGKVLRLLVDDEPFDVRYGELVSHVRRLDLRSGVLHRSVEWISPAGQGLRLRSERLVSFAHRAVAAIRYCVEPVGDAARLVVQSELVANEPQPVASSSDPRLAATLTDSLEGEHHHCGEDSALLMHRTRRSRLRLAAAMDHLVDADTAVRVSADAGPDLARITMRGDFEPGESLTIVKLLGYGWSSTRSRQALQDQVEAALTAARDDGWDGLVAAQREYLDEFWERSDIEIDGDPELQQAVRFALFHVLQAGARSEQRPIPAKGLTGTGYSGHTFWDSEAFVLPVLDHLLPHASADALRWRHSTLGKARARASALGLKGAAFPWRTIDGEECSGYWPAGTAAFHNNAAIAEAVVRHVDITGDRRFEREIGVDLVVETARLWSSLGHTDQSGRFRIDGVTGPDEYTAIVDNNVYTNLLAQRNLRAAAELVERHGGEARRLGVTEDERAAWLDAAGSMTIPYDERLGVHPQSEGFTDHARWDFEQTPPESYPLFRSVPYFALYRSQVVKQADVVLAMHVVPEAFDTDVQERNFAYYEAITVRDSSLSAISQAVVAARLGHLELAAAYLCETALVDLRDLHGNARDGLHIAAMAGAWTTLVEGFLDLRVDGQVRLAPQLPIHLRGMTLRLPIHGRRLLVAVSPESTRYELRSGDPLDLVHHGQPFTLGADPVDRPNPPTPHPPPVRQPPYRRPVLGFELGRASSEPGGATDAEQ